MLSNLNFVLEKKKKVNFGENISICCSFEKYKQKVLKADSVWEFTFENYIPGYFFKIVSEFFGLKTPKHLSAFLHHKPCDKNKVEREVDYLLEKCNNSKGQELLIVIKKRELFNDSNPILKKTTHKILSSCETFEEIYEKKIRSLVGNEEKLLKFVQKCNFAAQYRTVVLKLCVEMYGGDFKEKRPNIYNFLKGKQYSKEGIEKEFSKTRGTAINVLKLTQF